MATTNVTKVENLVNPEVLADMVSAKIGKRIVVAPFATIDNTLEGRAGDTITLPKWQYIGAAEDVAEGVECDITQMSKTSASETVKKVMKGVELTDEAVLSGYGDPVGEAASQLAKAVDDKVDEDCMDELNTASLTYTAGAAISYEGIVNAIDVFQEEVNTMKVMFIAPSQLTALRKDSNFISADKYGAGTNVIMKGEIGRIANCAIVPSKRVKAVGGVYFNPIVKLQNDTEEDDAPALTIYMKKGVTLEEERFPRKRSTQYTIDKHYVAALTNEAKVVIAKFTGAPASI